ncbi:hypothetical protein RA8CHR_05165 [Variovorax sp. RA8]|nr:hypothetical protein RA8CHR_05165 [Variovorax sp. RA8]
MDALDLRRRLFQGTQLLFLVNRNPAVVCMRFDELCAREAAFEDQNRASDAGVPQLNRFVQKCDCKPIRRRLERSCARDGTVPIGVRLEHREGSATMKLPGQAVVPSQRLNIDQRTAWAAHDGTPAGCRAGKRAALA